MDVSCFNNIVGVSKNPCSCLTASATSLSGLYLDDVSAGTIPLNQMVFNCNDSTITTFLENVVIGSTHEVLRGLRMEADRSMKKNYIDINTVIGWADTWTGYLDNTANWRYISLKPRFKRGSYFKLDKISIYLESGMFSGTIKVIKQDQTVIYDGLLSAFPATKFALDQTVYIAYQSDSRAKNITAKQCCGYNPTYPTYIELGSNNSALITDVEHTQNISTNGIVAEGQFICDGFDFICKLDFNTNFGALFANTIQQTARLNLGRWLLSSDKVTNYTLLSKEQLVETCEYLQARITENIKYLPLIYSHTDCYSCFGLFKGSIKI